MTSAALELTPQRDQFSSSPYKQSSCVPSAESNSGADAITAEQTSDSSPTDSNSPHESAVEGAAASSPPEMAQLAARIGELSEQLNSRDGLPGAPRRVDNPFMPTTESEPPVDGNPFMRNTDCQQPSSSPDTSPTMANNPFLSMGRVNSGRKVIRSQGYLPSGEPAPPSTNPAEEFV